MHHTVAIIDDSKTDIFIAQKVIERSKAVKHILTFSSGDEALKQLKLRSSKDTLDAFPTLIFLDIHMPGITGLEFLEHFSRFPEHIRKQCSIVMVSSLATSDISEKLRPYAFVKGHIQKPISGETAEAYLQ